MLRPFDVETPGRWSGAGAGEAGVKRGIDGRQSIAHGATAVVWIGGA